MPAKAGIQSFHRATGFLHTREWREVKVFGVINRHEPLPAALVNTDSFNPFQTLTEVF
ncbi:MAG: hypothetical protein LM550_09375 [Candidatus Contendobacter sp.]|jgi:hypothetical protein|nr:hypothetical protein [Gammaproteobacteria bacterium]MCC8993878.1 hypothetical protein [Candidatus Contendobacter sp.]